MNDAEYREAVYEIVKRQQTESCKMMDEAIADSDIPPEHHAMVRAIARIMMIEACNQKEEREYLLKELMKKVK